MRPRPLVFVVAVLFLMIPTRAVAQSDGDARGIRPEEAQTERLYQAALGRQPDPGGFDYWLRLRTSGLPLDAVADFFVTSPEYQLRFGADADGEFVDRLYLHVMNRLPDPAGRAYWLALLDQPNGEVTRDRLVVLFSESPEFIALTDTALPALLPFDVVVTAGLLAEDLGASWRVGCPVAPVDLVRVELSYVDFGGTSQTGSLVVHREIADEAIGFFRVMYENRMPIGQISEAGDFDGDDDRMMAANNTSSFNCRAVTGGTAWSRHAYGMAMDINPLYNPYVTADGVLPPGGEAWAERLQYHPAMLRRGDPLVTAVLAAGWEWGGDWQSIKDYQHVVKPR